MRINGNGCRFGLFFTCRFAFGFIFRALLGWCEALLGKPRCDALPFAFIGGVADRLPIAVFECGASEALKQQIVGYLPVNRKGKTVFLVAIHIRCIGKVAFR